MIKLYRSSKRIFNPMRCTGTYNKHGHPFWDVSTTWYNFLIIYFLQQNAVLFVTKNLVFSCCFDPSSVEIACEGIWWRYSLWCGVYANLIRNHWLEYVCIEFDPNPFIELNGSSRLAYFMRNAREHQVMFSSNMTMVICFRKL